MRLLAILIPLVLVGCANLSMNDVYRNPTFEYQRTQVSDVNFSQLAGRSSVSIKNSNPYSLPINRIDAQLWLEGKPWLDLENNRIQGLPAQNSVVVNFDWNLIFDDLLKRASKVYEAGEAEFTIKISPTFSVPVLGPQTVGWSYDFTVPVPKLPKLKMTDWRLENVTFTGITLALDLEVFNPNSFGIQTQGWNMKVGNARKNLADIRLTDSLIQSKEPSSQTVEIKLSIVDVGLALVNALKSGQWPSELTLDWSGKWQSPDLGFALPDLAGKL